MAEEILEKVSDIQMQTLAEEVAKKYGRKACNQLGEQWDISLSDQERKIFIAAFASGAHTGMTILLDSLLQPNKG